MRCCCDRLILGRGKGSAVRLRRTALRPPEGGTRRWVFPGLGLGWVLILLGGLGIILTLFTAGRAGAEGLPLEKLRPGHPRLFLNADMLPQVRRMALGPEQGFLSRLRELAENKVGRDLIVDDGGTDAAALAVLNLVEPKIEVFEAARDTLEKTLRHYKAMDEAKKNVDWTSSSQINALCAYDWLYPQLTPAERKEFGRALLDHVDVVRPGEDRRPFAGGNWSEKPGRGMYGTASLLFYAGLVLYGEGIDDAKAEQFLRQGYELYQREFEVRRDLAGDDGGLINYTLNYALAMYPWAEFNFFHAMSAAFGVDEARRWPYVPLLANYVVWNLLPGSREFGAGDAYHETNELPDWYLYTHLAQIRHFYGQSHPDLAALAAWLQTKLGRPRHAELFPAVPFLLFNLEKSPSAKSPDELGLPPARHFDGMGQVFMRSDWSDRQVTAMIVAGGRSDEHKHFDELHFGIYHQGYLALDTGSRPEPGSHLFNYYCRTVAHNSILIRMPGEEMPDYWGNYRDFAPNEPPLSTPNDGGQQKAVGGRVAAFVTRPEFTYIAADATAAYKLEKCRKALRRFLFIPPRYFVIFDEVEATEADYSKTWLLHLGHEPRIAGPTFGADHDHGRLIGQTLWPKDAQIKTIGGPGKQFVNGTRNWPFPSSYRIQALNELVGQWRIEISPAQPSKVDYFLHLFEVGGRHELVNPTPARLLEAEGWLGVAFKGDGDMDIEARFSVSGSPRLNLKYQRGASRFEQTIGPEVQPQEGLAARPKQP